jgi:predicted short-subunit dehydrogenase-like oxidoreductase (DUF2520 family)
MKFTKKDNLIIIGAGKISYSLAPAISEAGFKIKSIISRNELRAKVLARRIKINDYSDNLENIGIKRGIFFLAVPDRLIKPVAKRLSTLNIDFPNSLFIHLSGSHNTSILKSLALKKAHIASYHIMQTFPSRKRRDIKNSFSAIETSSKPALDYLFKFSRDLELNPFKLDSNNKVTYHLAGVFASNFINAVLFQSQQLFNIIGIKQYSFNDIFAPLYSSTIKNIKQTSPATALSGPIERGDIETIKKHIVEIKRISGPYPDILLSYLSLSLLLIDASRKKFGKLQNHHIALKELLIKELNKIKYKLNQ